MAQPIGFEQVESSPGDVQLKEKGDLNGANSDEKLVVDVEGGRPRLNTAARVSGWWWIAVLSSVCGCVRRANLRVLRARARVCMSVCVSVHEGCCMVYVLCSVLHAVTVVHP